MKKIKKTAEYPHPPEKVWLALTTAEALAEWLMPNTFKEAVVGHCFRFQYDPDPICSSGIVKCRVIEVEPPRRMVWEWQNGPMKTGASLPPPMRVEWLVEATSTGSRLTLIQTELRGQPWIIPFAMRIGWGIYLKKMLPQALAAIQEGIYQRGAIPISKRMYKATNLPPEVTL